MPGLTTSPTLTNQFQNYFSKELLSIVQQETILDQFAMKAPIPRNNGNRAISMFRFGPPSISGVQTLAAPTAYANEGVAPAVGTYRQLALLKLDKALTQYGQVIGLSDILRATDLFNSLQQSTKTSGLDMALWVDSVIRNTLIGSNLTASNGSIGSAAEGGGTFDNSDACGTWDAKLASFFELAGRARFAVDGTTFAPAAMAALAQQALADGVDAAQHAALSASTRADITLLAERLSTACADR